MAEVFVAGSINQDFVLRVERRPQPGETVTGAELSTLPGGKGANQATAAARLGASVAMLGRVGEDSLGEAMLRNLREKGVDSSRVEAIPGISTGAAFITVTPDGENAIVVSPGANHRLMPEDVSAAAQDIRAARVLVAQMELPVETVARAAEVAASGGTRFVLNLAPMREVPDGLLEIPDPLVVNEHEAAFLLGTEVEPVEDAREAAGKLLELGPRSAVITLGAAGAVFAGGGKTGHFPAPEVEVVDTTGAGDAFVGALAVKLARGDALGDAVSYAVRAGSAAVTKPGAQGSLPTPEVVERL
ncbi:ribokinase [Rubrobacter taiwanensis]|uniref:Ribokinase n=1 Tax=Rubrobacter taiwanensis TaxID=185139 RepID=A0A4R1BPU6_9ACTN|nr:ribokinase [Rubrobacter taiwanensis]TCJ19679.1 ribokinase [Rubrobacter taiwanensis]